MDSPLRDMNKEIRITSEMFQALLQGKKLVMEVGMEYRPKNYPGGTTHNGDFNRIFNINL